MRTVALLLCIAMPAHAADDAPLADVPGTSVHLATGQPAPFAGRLVSDAEHVRREKVNERDATFYADVTAGDVVVVGKPAFYALIGGAGAAVIAAIVAGVALAAKK